MDAFLLALILTFLIALGGREQLIIAQFSSTTDRNVPLLIIGIACAIATASVMAYAGSTMATILPRRAAEMLVAFALVAGAVELAWPIKLKPMKEPVTMPVNDEIALESSGSAKIVGAIVVLATLYLYAVFW